MAVPFFGGRVPVPVEVVENIAFALLASAPLDSLSPILPFLRTSKAVLHVLSPTSGTTLYSRLCRLKFDVDALERRTSRLSNRDLTDQLLHMETSLKCIRRGDVFDQGAGNSLLTAFIMMLHDNGKNRAQLKNAGIVSFVDLFIRLRLHEAKESNDMWPIENTQNAAALWLSWLLTTKEQLENESEEKRDNLIDLILPFLLCPYRYASAYAPSNHFILPLRQEPPTFHTIHGPFPVYHTRKQSIAAVHFFQSILLPPITTAAKLLFWCRRETKPFFNTSVQIPRNRDEAGGNAGLTLEDLIEFNSSKVAKLRPVVLWDWDKGRPITFNDDGSRHRCSHEPSKQWDMDWWRTRMCHNVLQKQPRWRLGNVYCRGLLSGLWQGVYFLSNTESLTEVLRTARCPDVVSGLFELLPRPMFMRLQEHNFVRTPGLSYATTFDRSSRLLQPNPIPAAQPVLMHASPDAEEEDDDTLHPVDVSVSNAWIPGPIGGLRWYEGDGINPSIKRDPFASESLSHSGKEAMRSTTFMLSPGLPSIVRGDRTLRLVASSEEDQHAPSASPDHDKGFLYETYAAGKESVHGKMKNAREDTMLCACDDTSPSVGMEPHPHPGCLRCVDRDKFLEAKKKRTRASDDVSVENIFESIGMGKRGLTSSADQDPEDEGRVFDLELHDPRSFPPAYSAEWKRLPHDRYQVEICDDGIEDTIVTGEPDERHRLAWGPSVYYGRVRPWDGMIAILKQHPSNTSSWNYGNFLFYGYIYGGDTFVGNWRFASMDPVRPVFENPFIMSKKEESAPPHR